MQKGKQFKQGHGRCRGGHEGGLSPSISACVKLPGGRQICDEPWSIDSDGEGGSGFSNKHLVAQKFRGQRVVIHQKAVPQDCTRRDQKRRIKGKTWSFRIERNFVKRQGKCTSKHVVFYMFAEHNSALNLLGCWPSETEGGSSVLTQS